MRFKDAYAREMEKVDVPWWNVFARCHRCDKRLKGQAIKWTDIVDMIECDKYDSHLFCLDCMGVDYAEWLKKLPERLGWADKWEATVLHHKVKVALEMRP